MTEGETQKEASTGQVTTSEPLALQIARYRYGHYPPTQEEIERELEALNRFAGAISTDPEILYAVAIDTDPSRLGLTMEDLEELRQKVEKHASRDS
mgnify:CR=1 FL=1